MPVYPRMIWAVYANDHERIFRESGGADEEIRTPDPFITSEVLYQLSYIGTEKYSNKPRQKPPEKVSFISNP